MDPSVRGPGWPLAGLWGEGRWPSWGAGTQQGDRVRWIRGAAGGGGWWGEHGGMLPNC